MALAGNFRRLLRWTRKGLFLFIHFIEEGGGSMNYFRRVFVISVLVLVTACGGGGGGEEQNPPQSSENGVTVYGSVNDDVVPWAQLLWYTTDGRVEKTGTANAQGEWEVFIPEESLRAGEFLIVEATNPANNLKLHSAIPVGDLLIAGTSYHGKYAVVSHYTEAAHILTSLDGALDSGSFSQYFQQVSVDSMAQPRATGHAAIDQLAAAVKANFDHPDASQNRYALSVYEALFSLNLPAIITDKALSHVISTPYGYDGEVQVTVQASSGIASANNQSVTWDVSAVAEGETAEIEVMFSKGGESIQKRFSALVQETVSNIATRVVNVEVSSVVPGATREAVAIVSTLKDSGAYQAGSDVPLYASDDIGALNVAAAEDVDGNILLLGMADQATGAIALDAETTARALILMSPSLMFRTAEERFALVSGVPVVNSDFSRLVGRIDDHLLAGTLWSEDETVILLAATIANTLIQENSGQASMARSLYRPLVEQGEPPYLDIDSGVGASNELVFKNPNLHYYAYQLVDAQTRQVVNKTGKPIEGRQGILDLTDETTVYGGLPQSTFNRYFIVYLSGGAGSHYDEMVASADNMALAYNLLSLSVKAVAGTAGAAITAGTGGAGAAVAAILIPAALNAVPVDVLLYHVANLGKAIGAGSGTQVKNALAEGMADIIPTITDTVGDVLQNAGLTGGGFATAGTGLFYKLAKITSGTIKGLVSIAMTGVDMGAMVGDWLLSASRATYLVRVAPGGVLEYVHAMGDDNADTGANIVRSYFAPELPKSPQANFNGGTTTLSWLQDPLIYGYVAYDENYAPLTTTDVNYAAGSNGADSVALAGLQVGDKVRIASVSDLWTESSPVTVTVVDATPSPDPDPGATPDPDPGTTPDPGAHTGLVADSAGGGPEAPPAATITVQSPNDTRALTRGGSYTISWDAPNLNDTVDIQLYREGGNDAVETLVRGAANDGSYTWSLPADGVVGTDFLIRISSSTAWGTIYDYSDATFVIAAGLFRVYASDTLYSIDAQSVDPSGIGPEGAFFNPNSWQLVYEAESLGEINIDVSNFTTVYIASGDFVVEYDYIAFDHGQEPSDYLEDQAVPHNIYDFLSRASSKDGLAVSFDFFAVPTDGASTLSIKSISAQPTPYQEGWPF